MKQLAIILGFSFLASLAVGCGDDGDDNGDVDAAVVDQMPALGGTQLDRAGRPAISTALIEAFNPDMAARTAASNMYGTDSNKGGWVAAYTGALTDGELGTFVRGSLSVIEALGDQDVGGAPGPGNVCGDHPFLNLGGGDPFATLGGLIADDQLYLNSAVTNDANQSYFAVEIAVATAILSGGTVMLPDDNAGGRKFENDVVDFSYSALRHRRRDSRPRQRFPGKRRCGCQHQRHDRRQLPVLS